MAAQVGVRPPVRLVLAATTDLSYDQRMQRICGSLAAAGYQVQLVGWQRPASVPLVPGPYAQHRLRGFFQRGKLFYLEYNLRLLLYLLGERASLWACADLDAALPTWLRARLGGQPFVYDAHELFTDTPEVVGRPAVRRVWRWVEDFIVPRARLRYTVGPALARLFEARHPGCSFAVVRNVPVGEEAAQVVPVGPAALGPGASPRAIWPATLLYQGALNVGRGLEALLAAMPQVPARLVVCGEGDLSAQLRQQAAGLGLLASGQVEFKGYVLPAELRRLTAQATVGIMLLENAGLSYYYSLANKFFDYVQAGIPQLCIDFPEYRALCQQYPVAELVPDLAPATLAAALGRLLPGGQPGAHYQQLAAACRQARREWAWQREEQVLLELYRQVLS
ncbi:glycosyltransferase family 4 protein [Hymenobacter sp. RP-2-7]|uniref:Glycosyltransferase family 4 protein n=1 Tax=Hymenobacter polaris TaxID=2682546 RepID=A0A7Y0ADH7_9BACT|nr:glycosyltransferase [Hymenobacter polaris]NML65344.1 glycosyltransferase family 4 protein [Hymenobacter polaris]